MSTSEYEEVMRELRGVRELLERVLDPGSRALSGPRDEDLRADDLVGLDYFSRRTGLSAYTIRHGNCGTAKVPVRSKRPRLFRKGDIDRFQREREEALIPARERGLRLMDRRGARRGRVA